MPVDTTKISHSGRHKIAVSGIQLEHKNVVTPNRHNDSSTNKPLYFGPLTIDCSARKVGGSNHLGNWKFSGAKYPDRLRLNDGGEQAGAGHPNNLDQLSGLHLRTVIKAIHRDAGARILKEKGGFPA